MRGGFLVNGLEMFRGFVPTWFVVYVFARDKCERENFFAVKEL